MRLVTARSHVHSIPRGLQTLKLHESRGFGTIFEENRVSEDG